MGYADIENLYKDTTVMLFKTCYAMEKIHGTSAHVRWTSQEGDSMPGDPLSFFSGGEKHAKFVSLFDVDKLRSDFDRLGLPAVTVYGEAYGGKCQGMSDTYGKTLKFIAFEVRIGDLWLSVPQAEDVVKKLGLEFVHYRLISTDIDALNAERDLPSEQAFRNGCADRSDPTTFKKREGIVLRPPIECRLNGGSRIIAKHKRDDFQEVRTPREVNPDKLKVLQEAEAIALEWATPMRLVHVMDAIKSRLQRELVIEDTGDVCREMVADVLKESKNEIVDSPAARKAISTSTAKMYTKLVRKLPEVGNG